MSTSAKTIMPTGAPPRVGESLQRLRLQRKMTLAQLSRAAGVSKSMLSEIERDKANPTIAVTWRLATALGVGLDQLLGAAKAPTEAVEVLAAHETPSLVGSNASHTLRILGPMDLAGHFEWYYLEVAKGGTLRSAAHEPGTVEHLTVLRGTVQLSVAIDTRRVRAGETARYAADQTHCIANLGRGIARGLLVVVHALR
jgi:transcriptional regulator with XRE-family HTH domain